MTPARPRRARPARPWIPLLALAAALAAAPAGAALPKVPDGFAIRLVAAVPAVTYPCQIATAPGGALFVAEDPMDQAGPYEADLGRIRLFRHAGEGDADAEPTIFAEGLRAVFGMAWRDGALYVMHMPYLSVFRDADGDGRAESRADLFTDLGPGPRGLNDHIVSGLQFGMDGHLYIAVGDKGVPGATRPEDGRTVQLRGGGILRCRPDGTGLEVYSTGTRNHLEPNLDDRDDLFTYDNTDDGDGWWTRVTHHVDGGYYGYPYDYHDRPDRHLPRLAEYGGGSPCGGVVYKEDAWPEPYRGRALWAEWGKRLVRAFRFEPDGASFKVADVIELVQPGDVGDFRPIDLALSHDGRTLYIADWGMGGWGNKNEKLGRVYAVTYRDPAETRPRGHDSDPIDDQIRQLDHPSFNERMRAQAALISRGRDALDAVAAALADPKTDPLARRHLVWALDGIAGGTPEASLRWIEALKGPGADVRAQAARALGERRVPIAVEPLAALLEDAEPTVRLQAIIALGRIGDPAAVPALLPALAEADRYLTFSARQALRRITDWGAAAPGLDSPDETIRAGLIAAMEEQYDPDAVALLKRVAEDRARPADERARALACLAQAHRKTKPWDGKWWGTRPTHGRPPAREIDWEGTPTVMAAVRDALDDPQAPVRIASAVALREIGDRESLPALRARFAAEPEPAARVELARALGSMKDREALPSLVAALADDAAPDPVRDASLTAIEAIGTDVASGALIDLLKRDDVPAARQPRLIAALGNFRAKPAVPVLVPRLASPAAEVRAASATALGRIGQAEGVLPGLRPLVTDADLAARKAAIAALGALNDRASVPALIEAAHDDATRYEATLALAAFPDTRALHVFLDALSGKSPELRKAAAEALGRIRDQAIPILDQLAARRELPAAALPELARVFTTARPVTSWHVLGAFPLRARPPIRTDAPVDLGKTVPDRNDAPAHWTLVEAAEEAGRVDLEKRFGSPSEVAAYAFAEVRSDSARPAQLVVGSDDTLTVWLNGRRVYSFNDSRGYAPEQARVEVNLVEGTNRLLVKCGNHGGGWMFSLAVTAAADYAFLKAPSGGGFDPEAFRAAALKGDGDPGRGRALFQDEKGLACIKCHTVGGRGGTVGPELSSIGAKYPRAELIAAVLTPSAKISQGYEPVLVATADGRVLSGIVKSDSPDALEIEDADARRLRIPKADIEDRKPGSVSIMPNGLAEGLSRQDFADLIAYLEALRQEASGADEGR